ncbi:MAG: hypothetical protein ABH882_07475 [Candidatus Omnitrophota bacterium]|nr:hypothetical protein [Candidatus Omnitrophota bacterium]MBU1928946.1 hypothetical protein [Candidatus Omnitrophota bacterium]MBU2034974.1 hypothetical protein [Candidatus Omnitrophota bacterium]MBU2257927.1 hypothetical protein [Candidatus Omnitrophota bacterium]
MENNTLRRQILDCAKNFKTSWVELGRSLYSVFRDKSYKEWGYNTFDAYTSKEIGIKKQTAVKLLRSYYFLEKEEPQYLKSEFKENSAAASIPTYESIDVLRLAKNKKELDEDDYNSLKKGIFEGGRDFREVKKDLTALIRQRQELEPDEAREKKKYSTLRRFLGTLKAIKEEIKISRLASAAIIKDAEDLIRKLEAELN